MAHNIATINGKIAMAYQGETPWHNLGHSIDDFARRSIDAAMSAAALDWQVSTQRMFLADGRQVENRVALVRDVDGQVLGTATDNYRIVQNSAAFGLFQHAIDKHGLEIETAGALGNGEKVWILFRLPSSVAPVPGDEINGYGLAIAGHDGRTAVEFRPTPIRVVCQNTLSAAVGKGGSKGRIYAIPHTGNVARQIDIAATMVDNVLSAMAETGETFAAMARRRMTPAEVQAYIETVFPAPKDGKIGAQLDTRRATVEHLITHGVGSDLALSETDGQPNAWAVYNAVTEYFDHVTTGSATAGSPTARANTSALFGSGAEIKLAALDVARELVTVSR
jgi:phage/plasmid-like protein (TIGR03299 family)